MQDKSKRHAMALGALFAVALMVVPPASSLGALTAPSLPQAVQPVTLAPDLALLDEQAKQFVLGNGVPCVATDPVPGLLVRAGLSKFTEEPTAGSWQTWFVGPSDISVPPPPDTASAQTVQELAELQLLSLNRTSDQVLAAQHYDTQAANTPWEQLALALVVEHSAKNGAKNPPRMSRFFALIEDAMFDALVITYSAKYCYNRPAPGQLDPLLQPIVAARPEPSYPSEQAAVAGVMAVIMPTFFPCPDPSNATTCEEPPGRFDNDAATAGMSRLWGGGNYRSDVVAGEAIGRAVANAVLAARANDGSNAKWDGVRPHGLCIWEGPAARKGVPVEPVWGNVKPFLMTSGSQFRSAPPLPDCTSDSFLAQTKDLYDTSKHITQRQYDIAEYWAGGQGTPTPPGMNMQIALDENLRHGTDTMRHARVMAYDGNAEADAAIGCWDMKMTYWVERPFETINRVFEPGWASLIATPPFPGYPSGHSSFSGASGALLSHFFPDDAIQLRALATEAADSRFYGGIHIRQDNEAGLVLGGHIADLAIERANSDGADA